MLVLTKSQKQTPIGPPLHHTQKAAALIRFSSHIEKCTGQPLAWTEAQTKVFTFDEEKHSQSQSCTVWRRGGAGGQESRNQIMNLIHDLIRNLIRVLSVY